MSKRMAILAGVVLAAIQVAPAAAQQQIGVSVRIAPRVEQPHFVAATGGDMATPSARVPAGWAWSVSEDAAAGGADSRPAGYAHVVARLESRDAADPRTPTATRGRIPRSDGRPHTVTWTFVPL